MQDILHTYANERRSMFDIRNQKKLVRNFFDDLETATLDDIEDTLHRYCAEDYTWRGYFPLNELNGVQDVARRFWKPIMRSLTSLQRRQDIFMAGDNEIDESPSIWVVSMGHLMGLFDFPWLGISPTQKIACLRYCEFHKIEKNRIVETLMAFDIPQLMIQADANPLPEQTAAHLVQPGPRNHDGLLFDPQPKEDGKKTLASINAMIRDLGTWQCDLPLRDELKRTWNRDMIWWGPAGIGATYTIERYAKQHAGPFRKAFTERSPTQHVCRLAEGHYGGFFGWPNFTATLTGDFMGRPATGKPADFRVVDIYRRSGQKLAENWVFIDLLYFWKQQGIDLLNFQREG